MAIQILPKQQSLGEVLGTGLGSGISSGIQNLLQQKMQKMQQSQSSKALQALGFSPEESMSLSSLDPAIQKEIVKQKLAAPSQEAFAQSLSELLGGEKSPENVSSAEQPQSSSEFQTKFQEAVTRKNPEEVLKLLSPEQQQKLLSAKTPEEVQEALSFIKEQKPIVSAQPTLKPKPRLNEQQATTLAKLGLQKQALSSKEQTEINKETKPVYDEIIKGAKSADDNDKRLDRISELIEKGDLGSPVKNSIIKTLSNGLFGFGVDLGFLMTADAQELDKLSSDFIKGAKDVFGSRVTDQDLKAYMKTIPNLMQSGAGMKRLINSLKSFNQANRIRKKYLIEIIKENKGKRPQHLDELVDERAKPELDVLSKKFVEAPLIPESGFGAGVFKY